jgi:WD40 repeat protein
MSKTKPTLVEKIMKKHIAISLFSLIAFMWLGYVYFSNVRIRHVFSFTNVVEARFSPASDIIALAKTDGTVEIVSLDTGKPISRIEDANYERVEMEFSGDGKHLITFKSNTVRIWDASTYNLVQMASICNEERCVSACFDIEKPKVYLSMVNYSTSMGTLYQWDFMIEPFPKSFLPDNTHANAKYNNARVLSSFSRSGLLVATFKDGATLIIDTQDGSIISKYKGGYSAAVSKCGTMLAIGGSKKMAVWDINKQQIIKNIRAHDSIIYSVRFGSFNKIVSASADGTARIWNIQGSCLAVLRVPQPENESEHNYVEYAELSRNNKFVLTVSEDEIVRVSSCSGW